MPIYEYGCDAGHRFEVTQKVTDPPVTTCRVCDLPVSKLISAPAIMFKGSGWYITDYSNKMKPPETGEKTVKPAAETKEKKDGAEKPAAAPAPAPSSSDSSSSNSSAGGSTTPASASGTPKT